MSNWTSLFDQKGFQTRLVKRFGVKKAAVHAWRHNGIPVVYCAGVEEECGGQFTRRDFRPDDWQQIWPELAEAA